MGALGLVAATGVGMARSKLRLTRRTLRLSRWREDGFRVAQVSDVHLNNDGELRIAREAVEWAVAQKPDLFVFTGDFVNNHDRESLARIGPAFAPLEDLNCPCLACLGNHDYINHNPPRVRAEVARTRLRLLQNEDYRIGDIRIVGLDDALFGNPNYAMVAQDRTASTLVLLHEPDFVDHVPTNAALVLSGHSHGGEICFPGGLPIHLPRGAKQYWRGYYPHARVPLYVNLGTATLGPARVYCPSEVAVFTLRPSG